MPRTLTRRPEEHPHNALKKYIGQVKGKYSSISNASLDEAIENILKTSPQGMTRKQKVEALLERHAVLFKKEWEEVNGFPFDTIYDQTAYAKQIYEQEQQAKIIAGAIDHRIMRRDGTLLTKEQFDQEPPEVQNDLTQYVFERIRRINESGYAGCLSNGNIVDRRLHPRAQAIQKNSLLGVPEPKVVPL